MNVRSYDRILEEADMAFFCVVGWTPDYPLRDRKGFFRVEKHVHYQAELLEGVQICVTAWLVATDFKRFHLFFQMWNMDTLGRAATMETMLLHMDLTDRKPALMRDDAQIRAWREVQTSQQERPVPEGCGRRVSMERQA